MSVGLEIAAKTNAPVVERRQRPTYADFERDFLRASRPVVLTGCMDQWPALGKWSPEFFKRAHAAAPVEVDDKHWTLGEFMDVVVASTPDTPAPYLKDAVVKQIHPDLMRDIEPFLEYCFPNWLQGFYPIGAMRHLLNAAQIELFVGGWGTRLGQLHFDYIHTHTVLCQIFGRKEFTIYAPSDTPWMYSTKNQSAVKNVDEVDLERYPLFAKATPIRFVQEPGEVVFLPCGWWHTTRLLTTSIAVGVNFANATNWDKVTQDVGNQVGAGRPLRRAFIKAFLTAARCWKSLQGKWAGAKKLGVTPRTSQN